MALLLSSNSPSVYDGAIGQYKGKLDELRYIAVRIGRRWAKNGGESVGAATDSVELEKFNATAVDILFVPLWR